ncbi:MAG TPA: amidase [Acidimicrobiales bacterium]|nr:amidase [Acidimicrobiales bacterium]
MGDELWRESATTLAQRIRAREVSSREVVESHLARIDAVNPLVNAVVEVRPEAALAEATRADEVTAAGGALGPLHGVPFTTKVCVDVAGYASDEGTRALADRVATEDAPIVERLRAAGAVMLARTNMPDLGLRMNTESSRHGATHNPWRHGYTAGGSSGGEGAALATGMSPLGVGSDVGGSLRSPAFCCGVASIKPSRGRVARGNASAAGEVPFFEQWMLVDGVLARRVADVRRGLEVTMGRHRRDPQSLDVPLHGPPAARRVALVPEPAGGATDPGVAAALRRAGAALEAAGYQVEERTPPRLIDAYWSWTELMMNGLAVYQDGTWPLLGDDARRFVELTTLELPPPSAASLAAADERRYAVARAWREFLLEWPLVVGPTWTRPPFPHGFDVADQASALAVVEAVRFTVVANVLGLPAACAPCGLLEGTPVGVQVMGDLMREDLCLDAAEVVERALAASTPIDPVA